MRPADWPDPDSSAADSLDEIIVATADHLIASFDVPEDAREVLILTLRMQAQMTETSMLLRVMAKVAEWPGVHEHGRIPARQLGDWATDRAQTMKERADATRDQGTSAALTFGLARMMREAL